MKTITREFVPCWYELSWQEKPPALLIRIHKDCMGSVKFSVRKAMENGHLIESVRAACRYVDTGFTGDLSKGFGFDTALERTDDNGDYAVFTAKIPKVCKKTERTCPHCIRGKSKFGGGKCRECRGTGKEYEMDPRKSYTLSASLTVFFAVINCVGTEIETDSKLPQLMEVNTHTSTQVYGGAIFGMFSCELASMITSLWPDNKEMPEVVSSMQTAYRRMYEPDIRKDWFCAEVTKPNGYFILYCPGDACGIYPSDHDIDVGYGYMFTCHNCDTPLQQITLLAGLAALHDKARREMKGADPVCNQASK